MSFVHLFWWFVGCSFVHVGLTFVSSDFVVQRVPTMVRVAWCGVKFSGGVVTFRSLHLLVLMWKVFHSTPDGRCRSVCHHPHRTQVRLLDVRTVIEKDTSFFEEPFATNICHCEEPFGDRSVPSLITVVHVSSFTFRCHFCSSHFCLRLKLFVECF